MREGVRALLGITVLLRRLLVVVLWENIACRELSLRRGVGTRVHVLLAIVVAVVVVAVVFFVFQAHGIFVNFVGRGHGLRRAGQPGGGKQLGYPRTGVCGHVQMGAAAGGGCGGV
jgi:hypothetical protein